VNFSENRAYTKAEYIIHLLQRQNLLIFLSGRTYRPLPLFIEAVTSPSDNLAGIDNAPGIERPLDDSQQLDAILAKLFRQVFLLSESDTMLA